MLPVWIERIIYGLLLFCVGGVGPFTYFDAFLPHHAHPYHLIILNGSNHAHNPLPLPTEIARQQLESQLALQPILLATQGATTPGLALFAQLTLSQGYVLTDGRIELCVCSPLTGRLQTVALARPSALLPPPDKPPTA